MRVLVTGASGFIGGACLRALAARGHEICAMVRPNALEPATRVKQIVRGTLASPPWREVQEFAPQGCVLAAWIATPGEYLTSPLNDDFQRWTIEFAQQTRSIGVEHFIGLGSCIEYQIDSSARRPLPEAQTPLAGNEAPRYVVAKNRTREILLEHHPGRLGWARIFQPFGSGEDPRRLCTSVARALLGHQPATISSPESVRDFTQVDDVARAVVCLMESMAVGDFNIGTGGGTTIREVAGVIAELCGSPPGAVQTKSPAVPDPYPYVVADATRLRSLGWNPSITLRQGLAQLVAGLRE